MNKLLILMSIMTPIALFAQDRYGWEYATLYGDIECVTKTTYYNIEEKFGEIIKAEPQEKEIYKFNIKGDVVECKRYRKSSNLAFNDFSLETTETFVYGKPNTIEETVYSNDGSIIKKIIKKHHFCNGIKYNDEIAYYNGNGSLYEKLIFKHLSDNIVEEELYKVHNGDGILQRKQKYKYDSKNNILEKTLMSEPLIWRKANEYNHNNTTEKHNICNEWTYKDIYEYNQYGDIEKISTFSNDSFGQRKVTEITYKYNTERNIIEEREVGTFIHKTQIYKYDTEGNMIETRIYDRDNLLIDSYINKYDSKKNRIEEIRYMGGIMRPSMIIKYNITYR